MQRLFSIESGETPPYFLNQFFSDIENAAELDYNYWYVAIRSDLHLYDDNGKLEIIKSKLDELRKNLEGSYYKTIFSVKDIKIKSFIYGNLAWIFEISFISDATEVEYSRLIDRGEYKYDSKNKILTVYPTIPYLNRETKFDFALIDEFKPLVEYLAWCMLFNKLYKIEAKIKQPEKKKEREAANYTDNYLNDEISEEDNFNLNHNSKHLPDIIPLYKEQHPLDEVVYRSKSNNDLTEKDSSIKDGNDKIEDGEKNPLYLADVFESASRYNHIMGILVEQKKCQPESHIWIGNEKGDYSYLAAILKYLRAQGYYKINKITNEQIKEICMNTFKWEISIHCIVRAKPEKFNLEIIPLASTLDYS